MSKRKSPTASKNAGNQKMAANAKRAIVKSPKHSHVALAAEGTTASVLTHLNDPGQKAPVVESSEPLQHDGKLSKEAKGFDVFSATANMQTYQARLLEISSSNIHFAFEFAQRLASIGSPIEFLTVSSEFTSKRAAMFVKHSKQMAELVVGRFRFG